MTQIKEQGTVTVNFQPLGNRVLVQRLPAEEKQGGIILPESAKKKQEQARVIAIGTGAKDAQGNVIEIPVKVGDIVLMEKYSGQEVTLDGEEYMIIRADDLIAVVAQ